MMADKSLQCEARTKPRDVIETYVQETDRYRTDP